MSKQDSTAISLLSKSLDDIMVGWISISSPEEHTSIQVLKAQIALENLLNRWIERKMLHPKMLSKTRLTFHQTLHLARAMYDDGSCDWLWSACMMINKLRNHIAHDAIGLMDRDFETVVPEMKAIQKFINENAPKKYLDKDIPSHMAEFSYYSTRLIAALVEKMHADEIAQQD